jgi:hypothetical protein
MQARQQRLHTATLAVLSVFFLAADKPDEISGRYEVQEVAGWGGAGLSLVLGEGRLLMYFAGSFGEASHTCECIAEGKPDGPGRFRVTQSEPSMEGTLTIGPDEIVLDLSSQQCCGAGFPGAPHFPRAKRSPLLLCTVKSAKANFHSAENQPTKAYLVAGDKVQASDPEPNDDTVLARFAGKKTTIGRLKTEDLDCP